MDYYFQKEKEMKKASFNILLLFGIFIIFGIIITLFAGAIEKNRSTAEPVIVQMNLAQQTERELFFKQLKELKEITKNLEQKNMQKFKKQTREGMLLLTDLINELPELPIPMQEDVLEETTNAKNYAEKLAFLEVEEEIVQGIKNGFTAALDGLEDFFENLNCEEEVSGTFFEKTKESFDDIEDTIEQLNKDNYKQITQKVFKQFYILLSYINNRMSQPEFLNALARQTKQNDRDKSKNKKDREKEKNKDKKNQCKKETCPVR